jgi:RNA polymerase sigma factor (sigma-70 family)
MTTQGKREHWLPLEALWSAGALGTKTDGELLEYFRTDRGGAGQEAFRILVERHGPMVLGLCRSLVKDCHEAEDAFQATFLVLVRKADSIRRRDTIGPWLHGVAARVARRAFGRSVRREKRERKCLSNDPLADSSAPEQAAIEHVVHEEIARLQESLRAPLVLCGLMGLSYDVAARQLGLTAPTLRGRLYRARKQLAARLRGRGIALPAVGPAFGPVPFELAVLPSSLVQTTVQYSIRLRALNGLIAGATVVPGSISALAEGVIKSMIFQACKLHAVGVLCAAGLLATVALAQQGKTSARGGLSNPVRDAITTPQDRPSETIPKNANRESRDVEQKQQAVQQQLSLIIDADFRDGVTLEEFLKYIKQVTTKAKPPGLPIYVDPVGLQEAEKSMSSKLIIDLKQRPVSVVLRSALRSVGLAGRAKDGFYMIESEEQSVVERLDEIDGKLARIFESLARLERAK